MLRHKADRRTFAYMAAASGVLLVQWNLPGFHLPLFLASLALAFAVSIMHHNHQHSPLWRHAALNRATDLWFTLFQGHPGFAFEPSHLQGHHTHRNGPLDRTRTWRLHDGNNLAGFIAHPVLFAACVAPLLAGYLAQLWRGARGRFWWAMLNYAWLAAALALAFWLDAAKAVLFIVLPQLAALFFLLGANYLQHAHADDSSRWNHSRNFLGWVNPLFFNIGYHTAHHEEADLHWSELPRLHAELAPRIDARLIEPGLGGYCLRVFLMGLLAPRLRSRSLRKRMKEG